MRFCLMAGIVGLLFAGGLTLASFADDQPASALDAIAQANAAREQQKKENDPTKEKKDAAAAKAGAKAKNKQKPKDEKAADAKADDDGEKLLVRTGKLIVVEDNPKPIAVPFLQLLGIGGAVVEVEVGPAAVKNAENAEVAELDDPALHQFIQQLRPVLVSELGLVRLMCPQLTPEQRRKIKTPAETGLKRAAKVIADQQAQRVVNNKKTPEPRALIREAILKAMQETVDEETLARYAAEGAKRAEKRKRAAIMSLVSRIDRQMFLTQEQREKITESISLKWQDGWEKWTMMSQIYGDRYFPVVPDPLIVPHLTADQKPIWQSVQKVDYGWWWNGQGGNAVNDAWWDDNPTNNAEPKPADARLQIFPKGVLDLFR